MRIIIDRVNLSGSVDLIVDDDPVQGSQLLAARSSHPDLASHPDLPDDTRLWAALQNISGGTWGGCVYDVDLIVERLNS